MIPEAQSKASLSVCQSRIVCIAVVPGARIVRGKNGGGENLNDGIIGKKVKPMKQGSFGHKHKKSLPSDMSDEDDEDFGTGAENIIAFDSSGDEDMHPHFMGKCICHIDTVHTRFFQTYRFKINRDFLF